MSESLYCIPTSYIPVSILCDVMCGGTKVPAVFLLHSDGKQHIPAMNNKMCSKYVQNNRQVTRNSSPYKNLFSLRKTVIL